MKFDGYILKVRWISCADVTHEYYFTSHACQSQGVCWSVASGHMELDRINVSLSNPGIRLWKSPWQASCRLKSYAKVKGGTWTILACIPVAATTRGFVVLNEKGELMADTQTQPNNDWIVRFERRKDRKKYYFRHDCALTARRESSMRMTEAIAKALAAAVRKNHPDFTARAMKYDSPAHLKAEKKPRSPKTDAPYPCPVCRGTAFVATSVTEGWKLYEVVCDSCGIRTRPCKTRQEAILAWNCRNGGCRA